MRFFELLTIEDYSRAYYQDYKSAVGLPSAFPKAVLGYDGMNHVVRVFDKYLRTLLLSSERVPRPDQWIQNANTDSMQILASSQARQFSQIETDYMWNVTLAAFSILLIKIISRSPGVRRHCFDMAKRVSIDLAAALGDPIAAKPILEWMCDTFNCIFGKPLYMINAVPRRVT
jgi:hypothetical protein